MNDFYMDTNVFMARFKTDDPYHIQAKSIVRSLEKGEIQAETSVFTLLEVASVSGRLYRKRKGEDTRKKAFVIKMIKKLAHLNTHFVNIAGDKQISIKGVSAILPSVFDEGILLSLQCDLKTLDLVHLAAARHSKRMNNELQAFVTGDEGFLSDKARLSGIIGMPILSPKEYVDGFGIGN
jgi:predicted nucleic acid-binding protein